MARTDRPYLTIQYNDPLEGVTGYLVIDRLVHGVAAGGLRINPGIGIAEITALARNMTLKQAAVGIQVGGAKAGLNMAPEHPARGAVLERFMTAIKPLILSCYSMGPDVNTQMRELDGVAARIGVPSLKIAVGRSRGMSDAAFLDRYALLSSPARGASVNALRPGASVAAAAHTLIEMLEIPRSVALQGAGTVGAATARLLIHHGIPLVAWADARRCLVDPAGLNVEQLLAGLNNGLLPAPPHGTYHPPEYIREIPAGCLILAAIQDALTPADLPTLAVQGVVAAANLSLSETTEQRLHQLGVTVIPDFIAGAGGSLAVEALYATDVTDGEGVLAHVETRTVKLTSELLRRSRERGLAPRTVAMGWAQGQLAANASQEISR